MVHRQCRIFLFVTLLACSLCSTSATTAASSVQFASLSRSVPSPLRLKPIGSSKWETLRGGGSSTSLDDDEEEEIDEDNETTLDITQHPEFEALQSYRLKQQMLMQLRATFLGEALAKRGLPMATIQQVATPEGAAPPQSVDWDCAMSTEEDPKSCLFSFDAEPGTKVVGPLGTTDWIGLATLNRLRREDPTKVEPMWHSKFAILNSWFDPESEYSLLQHVGAQGLLLNSLLQGYRLQIALGITLMVASIVCMPILEYVANRFLVSSFFWSMWPKWYRFAHAALPLKLFIGQFLWSYLTKAFGKLTAIVKDVLVEMECQILEQNIPLTVGVPDMIPPSQQTRVEEQDNNNEEEFLDYDDLDFDDDEDEESFEDLDEDDE